MLSFKSVKKKWRKMFFVLSRALEKQKILSPPLGIEPQTFGFCVPMLHHKGTETL